MRRLAKIVPILVLCGMTNNVWAAGLTATIDKTHATLEDQLLLTLEVTGSSRSEPQLPPLPDFVVQSRGQSSQVQIINGRMRSNVSFNYILTPKKSGQFTIGSARVEIADEVHFSKPISIKISKPEAIPQQNRPAFVLAEVNNETPYVGEQVVYTFRFFRRVQIANAKLDLPTFDGFVIEDMGEQREYEIVRGGQKFIVTDVKKALFPQEAGIINIPAAVLNADIFMQNRKRRRRDMFDDFFGSARGQTQTKVLRTDAMVLRVKNLPASTQKSSGLIGAFDIKATLTKSQLRAGESTTLEVTISGVGNIQQITKPTLPQIKGVKIYEDKTSQERSMNNDRLRGQKTFRWAVIPLEAGLLEIPKLTLHYFDVEAGTHLTKHSANFLLNVTPSGEKEELRLTTSQNTKSAKLSVEILGEDISPIHAEINVLNAPFASNYPMVLWFLFFFSPPFLFFGLFLNNKRLNKSSAERDIQRQSKAAKKALKRVQEVAKAEVQNNIELSAQTASQLVRDYLGDKALLEGRALTTGDVSKLLQQQSIPQELIQTIQTFLELCDTLQYAGRQTAESSTLSKQLPELIKKIERHL